MERSGVNEPVVRSHHAASAALPAPTFGGIVLRPLSLSSNYNDTVRNGG